MISDRQNESCSSFTFSESFRIPNVSTAFFGEKKTSRESATCGVIVGSVPLTACAQQNRINA
jgi:hypothetical protein